MFADRANIIIRSGKGGDGHLSFRRELYVPILYLITVTEENSRQEMVRKVAEENATVLMEKTSS